MQSVTFVDGYCLTKHPLSERVPALSEDFHDGGYERKTRDQEKCS